MIFNRLFTQYLIEKQIIDEPVAKEWLERADTVGTPLYTELVRGEVLDEETAYRTLADYLGLDYRFCQLSEINLDFLKYYPRDLLIEHQGVPFSLQGDILTVLCSNPFRMEELRELIRFGGRRLNFVI